MALKRFTDAQLAAILVKQGKTVDFAFRKDRKPRATDEPSESQSQQAVMRWWAAAHRSMGVTERTLLMAFPLQGARTARNGARMKAEGCRKGTPDMLLAVSRGGKHGLWMEMKTKAGKVSPEQRLMIHILTQQNYEVAICRSTDECIEVISEYLLSDDTETDPVSP